MSLASSTHHGSRSRLLRLPTELLFCIADVCTPASVLNLVCCNKYLHELLYGFFRRLGVTAYGGGAIPWAANRGDLEFLQLLHHHGGRIFQQWGLKDHGAMYEKRIPFESVPDPEPQHQFRDRVSPLHLATMRGHDHIVSWLIDAGADVNDPCMWRGDLDNALSLAFTAAHDSTAKILIEKGAAIVTTATAGDYTMPTLELAISSSALEATKLLLTLESCLIDEPDTEYTNPLGRVLLCCQENRSYDYVDMDFLRLLLTAGASLTMAIETRQIFLPLHCAVLEGSCEAALLLLDAGADPKSESAGYQPLHCAFNPSRYHPESAYSEPRWRSWQSSRAKFVKALLAAGADPNARAYPLAEDLRSPVYPWNPDDASRPPTAGVTPLMYAAANGTCLESMETLIGCGADVNAIDECSQNALHWALHPIYEPLDDAEDISDKMTPSKRWDKAVGELQVTKVCELLLENGCNPAQKNSRGQCAIELLSNWENPTEILWVFLDHMSEDWVRECAGALVEICIQTEDFDAISMIEDSGWLHGGTSISASALLACCRDFPVTNRFADEVLRYFSWMIRFAERHGLIHSSEAEEHLGPRGELRDYLLAEEAKAVQFIKEYPHLFPNLFPTVEQPEEPELKAEAGGVESASSTEVL
ncbi:ankyrin [Coniochaeta ligniaria NRRL 30616]|uniref:Ankyrin n=1 Tax=Coniochaeta ligniaria NRRL 30616 TaxID=1408157 RepID=A0A1J7IVZ2_9PEZI|nr:ankyrin [Coniochaeta ligniaria NRRL 30616]